MGPPGKASPPTLGQARVIPAPMAGRCWAASGGAPCADSPIIEVGAGLAPAPCVSS